MVTIKYNGTSIDTPIEKFYFSQSYTSVSIATKVLVTGATATSLISNCEDLEALCQLKNKRVQLNFGGSNEYDYNPVTTTGFTSRCVLQKIRSESDLELSRIYELKIGLEIPYTEEGFGYRRDASFTITLVPNLHRIAVFNVDYTSGGGFPAIDNYENEDTGGKAWAQTILEEFGEDWIKTKEYIGEEQERNLLSATITYFQLLSTCTIKYNGTSIVKPVFKFGFTQNYKTAKISSPIFVKGVADPSAEPPLTAQGDLIAKCTALESLCQLKNKRVELYLSSGGANYDYNPDSESFFSGFSTRCVLKKSEGFFDQETTRLYNLFIDLEIPYKETGFGYRRDGTFVLSYDTSGQRRFDFRCEYTSGGNFTAIENYNNSETGGRVWANTIIDSFLGESETTGWDLSYENIEETQERNVIKAKLVYKEVLFPEIETSGGFATQILEASCKYTINIKQAVGNPLTLGFNTKPICNVEFNYKATIKKEITPEQIETVYRGAIKPWIFKKINDILGTINYKNSGTNIILTDDSFSVNPYTNQIIGQVSAITTKDLDQIYSYTERIIQIDYSNMIEQELWNGVDYTCNLYSFGKTRYLTRNVSLIKLGDFIDTDDFPPLQQEQWILLERRETRNQEKYDDSSLLSISTKSLVSHQQLLERYKYVEALEIIQE